MKLFTQRLLIFTMAGFSLFAAAGEETSKAKVAELALHRIERLVLLKKIDNGFQNQFNHLTLVDAESNDENINFIANATQYSDNLAPHTIDIYLDPTGRTVRHSVTMQTSPAEFPVWGAVDPVTLTENSLHYIQENWQSKPELSPYNANFSTLNIAPGISENGTPVGVVDIHSTESNKVLRILIRQADGAFDSAAIIE